MSLLGNLSGALDLAAHDAVHTMNDTDSSFESTTGSSSQSYDLQINGIGHSPIIPDSSSLDDSTDDYEMNLEEDEESSEEESSFEPSQPFRGVLPINPPTVKPALNDIPHSFNVDTPEGLQTVELQVSKGDFDATFSAPAKKMTSAPTAPAVELSTSEEESTSINSPHTVPETIADTSVPLDVLHKSMSRSASQASSHYATSVTEQASEEEEEDEADLFAMIVEDEESDSRSDSGAEEVISILGPVSSSSSPRSTSLYSSLSSSSSVASRTSTVPPPPSDSPPKPNRLEYINPSGQDSIVASPRASSSYIPPHAAAMRGSPSSHSGISAGDYISSQASQRSSIRFATPMDVGNGSISSHSSKRLLRGHVPSKVAVLVSQTVESNSKKHSRRTTLTNTFTDAVDLAPLTGSNFDAPSPTYGTFAQPPMLLPPPPGYSFQFVYDHPMDEKVDENGTFAAHGRYLVDLEVSRLASSLTMSFLAPCATLLTNQCIGFLPSSITAIDLSDNQHLTDACFSDLPPTLLHLDLRSATQVTDDSLVHLPRSLQYLNLRSARLITSGTLAKLPKTLTHLKLSGQNPNFKCDGLAKLPRMLRTLKIDYLYKLTKTASAQLPSRLTRLDLPRCLWIRDKAIAKLPTGLTHLNLHSATDMTSAAFALMPANLVWLDCETTPISNDQHMSHLPPSLQTLHLTLSNYNFVATPNFSKLSVLVLNGPLDESTPLPNTLTGFKYICATPPTSCSAFTSMLPISLRFLDVVGVPWDDESILELPRELCWLAIQSSLLSSGSFKKFPPSLEYLKLSQMRVLFRSEELANLPRGLKYLHLDAHPHNKALLKTCPRYFPEWVPSTELAAAGEALFGPQDSCDGVGGHSSFASFAGGSAMSSASVGGASGRVEDPNLWTALGQQEIDSHEPAFASDGSMIHGAGYLYPFDYMDDSANTNPWIPQGDTVKRKKVKKLPFVAWDPSMASMSPFDLHLVARKVARRSLLPPPSEKAKVIDEDLTDQDIMAGIPSNELVARRAVSITPIGIASLPTKIEYVDLRRVSGLISTRSFSKTFKRKEDLIVANFESNIFKSTSGISKLSKVLTHIDLSSSTIGKDVVDLLPRTLNYLALGCESAKFSVPPSLTALFLGSVHKIKDSFIAKLPRTLVYFDCYSAVEVEPVALSKLPKNTLRYLNFHSLTYLPDYYFACLPRHLVYLSLASVEGVSDRAVQALPRTLTHLDLSSAAVTSVGIASLPSRLTHLSIDIEQSHDRLECIAYLPRNLRILNYRGDVKDSWLDFLPPHLAFLNLPFAFSMSPNFVAHLPPHLIFLGAHSWTRSLAAIPFSCTELIYLDLYNADLSHTDWNVLPRSVQYVSSNNLVVRNASAASLPAYNAQAKQVVIETLFLGGDIYP